jgi:Cytochrome P450
VEVSKEEAGSRVPMFTSEQVDEIVIAQVRSYFAPRLTQVTEPDCLLHKSCMFLIAGYDTTATTLSHICFLLARNPEVQDKLHHLTVEKIERFVSICINETKLSYLTEFTSFREMCATK